MKRSSKSGRIMGELALVEAIRRRAGRASGGLRLGIGDDCAVLRPGAGQEICVTTDFSLEGVHFRRDWHAPASVGHRCLARGLSDLAAMGAEPLGVFLSLAVPAGVRAEWVDRFLDGFLALAARHRVTLAGGDTAQSPGLLLADIVAVGQAPRGKALLRSGARTGDFLYVTGALGGAAAELRALAAHPKKLGRVREAAAGHPHLFPEPRLAVGRRLRGVASAMIDVSDGLSTDLAHLCRESGVAATVEEAALPIHPLAARWREGLKLGLDGGEDYELLFTASPGARVPRRIAGTAVHRIGEIRALGRGKPLILMHMRDGKERLVLPGGWEHFRQGKKGGRV
jgi:thiamine-monophosphate kinase